MGKSEVTKEVVRKEKGIIADLLEEATRLLRESQGKRNKLFGVL